jgi:hypothetical protein
VRVRRQPASAYSCSFVKSGTDCTIFTLPLLLSAIVLPFPLHVTALYCHYLLPVPALFGKSHDLKDSMWM